MDLGGTANGPPGAKVLYGGDCVGALQRADDDKETLLLDHGRLPTPLPGQPEPLPRPFSSRDGFHVFTY